MHEEMGILTHHGWECQWRADGKLSTSQKITLICGSETLLFGYMTRTMKTIV